MDAELRVLLVEDLPTDAEMAVRELKRAGLRFTHRRVDTEESFRAALDEFRPDIILSDFSMPSFDGMRALAIARDLAPQIPFIFVSGTIGEEHAVRALKDGATDYVLKGHLVRLPPAVVRSLEESQARAIRENMERELRESHERFRVLLETAPDAILLVDSAGKMVLANAELERVFGYTREEILGKSVDMLLPDTQRVAHAGHRTEYLSSPKTLRLAGKADMKGRRKDGSLMPVEIVLGPVVFNNETHVIAIVRDVTESREQQLKIARLTRIYAVLSEINSAIVRVRDRQQLIKEACRIAVKHGGFGIAWIGRYDPEKKEVVPEASAGLEGEYSLMHVKLSVGEGARDGAGLVARAIRERRAMFSRDISLEPEVGGERRREAIRRGYRSVIVLPLVVGGSAAGILMLFAKGVDFFDEEELKLLNELAGDISFGLEYINKEEQLNHLAYYDQLTALPNRALFHERLSHELRVAGQKGRKVALVVSDIKRFRLINESLGRHAGDRLLGQFAARLKGAWSDPDNVARVAADCFACILADLDEESEVAQALKAFQLETLAKPFEIDGHDLAVAVTGGIAVFPMDGLDAETLFNNAETALKKAKSAGERYLFYQSDMNAAVAQVLSLENRMRRALENDQFILYYQPKIAIGTGRVCGVEALIRWNDPDTGIVPPSQFIPILEETGMIVDAGKWAIEEAVSQYREWLGKGLPAPRIAVNVSAIQLRQKDFVDTVRGALAGFVAGEHGLDLEITESVIMESMERSTERLGALRSVGVNVAIDDFGTGYSSLGYLAKLPINTLKIDRSFILTMTDDPDNMTIVSTMISLAHSLNLCVVAEGVETEEQRKFLRLLRCDEIQGYLISKPLPAGQLEARFLQPH